MESALSFERVSFFLHKYPYSYFSTEFELASLFYSHLFSLSLVNAFNMKGLRKILALVQVDA